MKVYRVGGYTKCMSPVRWSGRGSDEVVSVAARPGLRAARRQAVGAEAHARAGGRVARRHVGAVVRAQRLGRRGRRGRARARARARARLARLVLLQARAQLGGRQLQPQVAGPLHLALVLRLLPVEVAGQRVVGGLPRVLSLRSVFVPLVFASVLSRRGELLGVGVGGGRVGGRPPVREVLRRGPVVGRGLAVLVVALVVSVVGVLDDVVGGAIVRVGLGAVEVVAVVRGLGREVLAVVVVQVGQLLGRGGRPARRGRGLRGRVVGPEPRRGRQRRRRVPVARRGRRRRVLRRGVREADRLLLLCLETRYLEW